MLDRRTFVSLPAGAAVATALSGAAPAPREPDATIRLWPGDAPGLLDAALADHVIDRSTSAAYRDRAYDRIRTPRLDVFRPARPNGAAVLLMPGGGFERVVIDKEGYELAPWFAERGVTAFVLLYRLPRQGWRDGPNTPLADAQRAMRLIRARAGEFGVDPTRVAAMGFSAGGHLCADLAVRHMRRVYDAVDDADRLDARPMLASPIYPVISMDPQIAHIGSRDRLIGASATEDFGAEHSPERQVSKATPPCFLLHAENDATVPVANSLAFRAALKAASIPVEMHLFEHGGHGFGWGRNTVGRPVHLWPELWWAWAKGHGLVS
jgi:acetyl esterase/lipase